MQNSLAVAQDIKTALLDHGVGNLVSPFTKRTGGVSIELQPGRGTAGRFVAQLNHDTVGPAITSARLTPSLYTCKNGRSDLQGPLCNGYGGCGDFIYRLITLEWANHPGLGGPVTTSAGVIPKDNGRPYLWGTEFEWDGVTMYPDVVFEWMARCNAGITDYFGHQVTDQFEHHDWAPTRKIDRSPGRSGRTSILRAESIALTRSVWNDNNGGDDDVSKQDVVDALKEVFHITDLKVPFGQLNNNSALEVLFTRTGTQFNEENATQQAIASAAAAAEADDKLDDAATALIITKLNDLQAEVESLKTPPTT